MRLVYGLIYRVWFGFPFSPAQLAYPGGVTLRCARVVRYRLDKRPEEADTIEAVRALGY